MAVFRAMGTDVSVLVPALDEHDEARVAVRIAALFEQTEQRFSRFRPDSELSALNRAVGPFVASRELFDALVRAREYHSLTLGMFDPTVGGALIALGYDRSFSPGALDRMDTPEAAGERGGFEKIRLEESKLSVTIPTGVSLDLGGMIKGHTVDRAATMVPGAFAVDAGGDAVVRGDGPEGAGWLVDIEDPFDAARTVLTLRVHDRAVATSAVNRRRWRAGRRAMHHLIDPRTGAPSDSDVAQVTVLAARAELAEVLAKAVLLLGTREGSEFLAERMRSMDLGAVLVTTAGTVVRVGALEVTEG